MSTPAWAPAGEPKPAPPPLLLVQSFVNTWDPEARTDLLAGGPGASAWLRETGLIGPDVRPGPDDLRTAREVREGVRALLARNGGGPGPDPADLGPLQELADRSLLRLSLDPAGKISVRPGGHPGRLADGLLGLLVAIRDAQADGSWARLKVCANHDCRWAFYDRSHSRKGIWCDMAGCGNMIKNRNLRARRGQRSPG
jgi:predicted RNA-binding Zn ribbon-like protein